MTVVLKISQSDIATSVEKQELSAGYTEQAVTVEALGKDLSGVEERFSPDIAIEKVERKNVDTPLQVSPALEGSNIPQEMTADVATKESVQTIPKGKPVMVISTPTRDNTFVEKSLAEISLDKSIIYEHNLDLPVAGEITANSETTDVIINGSGIRKQGKYDSYAVQGYVKDEYWRINR
ncbi:MAG: hypothetical protein OEX12_00060 [Gammaproteobacteria bacterium]|nr:hypothetical protein [Gammaproteobacteria bacterium]